jgi:hypothetical protein
VGSSRWNKRKSRWFFANDMMGVWATRGESAVGLVWALIGRSDMSDPASPARVSRASNSQTVPGMEVDNPDEKGATIRTIAHGDHSSIAGGEAATGT